MKTQKQLIYKYQYKFTKKKTKKHASQKASQKTIRIITITTEKNECKNDMNVYIDIFKKLGYKIDTHILDTHPKIHIKYAPNPYYDINVFIDRITPIDFKTIFPSRVNIFAPNMNTFINYKEIRYIDIVLCNTKQCYKFINFIRKENNYKFKFYYTNFTTHIPIQLSHLSQLSNRKRHNTNMIENNTKPMSFIHIADNQKYKNTGSIIHCWLKYNISLDCNLHIICNGLCFTTLLLDIKKMYHYDLLNTYKFETESENKNNSKKQSMINNILNYKNLFLYLDLIPRDIQYKELIKNTDVAICPSSKENYPHYINSARYFNIFVITMNHSPMNELIMNHGSGTGSGYLLKKSKLNKKVYKETHFNFYETYPNIEELRESILWCLEHQIEIRKYNNSNHGRHLYDQDKKYYENSIEKIVKSM